MPTKKNKIRDLKPTKDAKGGGGRGGTTQGGGAVDGGRGGTTQNLTPGLGKGAAGKIVNPNQTEGGSNWGG